MAIFPSLHWFLPLFSAAKLCTFQITVPLRVCRPTWRRWALHRARSTVGACAPTAAFVWRCSRPVPPRVGPFLSRIDSADRAASNGVLTGGVGCVCGCACAGRRNTRAVAAGLIDWWPWTALPASAMRRRRNRSKWRLWQSSKPQNPAQNPLRRSK